jgi:hypothetical protein
MMKLVLGKLFKTMFSAKMQMFTRLVCSRFLTRSATLVCVGSAVKYWMDDSMSFFCYVVRVNAPPGTLISNIERIFVSFHIHTDLEETT